MAGYSGTPLPQKLGLAKLAADPKAVIRFVNPPPDVTRELGVTKTAPSGALDFALLFVRSQAELRDHFPALAKRLKPAGMLWVSWPKKSSGIASDLTEDVIRDFGLKTGLVDVKVCAVTEIWSGLKFVVRLKDRPKAEEITCGTVACPERSRRVSARVVLNLRIIIDSAYALKEASPLHHRAQRPSRWQSRARRRWPSHARRGGDQAHRQEDPQALSG